MTLRDGASLRSTCGLRAAVIRRGARVADTHRRTGAHRTSRPLWYPCPADRASAVAAVDAASPRPGDPASHDRTAHHRRQDLGRPRRRPGPGRPGRPRGRPPPRPRGDLARRRSPAFAQRGLRSAARARPSRRRTTRSRRRRAACRCSTRRPPPRSASSSATAPSSASRSTASARRRQGIVHVIGPQLGLTQPGMTIVCGDSHTSTHGAFGALAFGIGTSEVEMVLATQTLLQRDPKTYEVRVDGRLAPGVSGQGHHPGADRPDRRRRRDRPRLRVPRRGHPRR